MGRYMGIHDAKLTPVHQISCSVFSAIQMKKVKECKTYTFLRYFL